MSKAFEATGWQDYRMDYWHPHRELEPLDQEIEVIDLALAELVDAGILPHADYDKSKLLHHRAGVREKFDIPWTAITPRMQRLLYAINAIAQPKVMVAVGIFCGNTFISNAGAAVGPGADYIANDLVGIELREAEAARAQRNVAAIDGTGVARIVAGDGLPWLEQYAGSIDLLYLDADGTEGRGKSIYLDLLQTGWHALRPGSIVIAHNSVNCAGELADYLAFVRDPAHLRASVNMIVDPEGIEVSIL